MPTPEGRAIYINGTWQYEFFYTDHLGSARVAFRANGNQLVKTSETAFDPWGVLLRGAGQENGLTNRFEYQNKESEKTFGLNRINLGARTYNTTIGRLDRVDALSDQMRRHSTYAVNFNNPMRFIDADGMSPDDIVYFNLNGDEVHRIKSNTEFRTFIQSSNTPQNPAQGNRGWREVPMPNIIQERTQSGENVSGKEYQQNDYIIAARTGLFNQTKNNGKLTLYTEGGAPISKEAIETIPDLDPTIVKAMAIQESHNGKNGETDILTANNPLDWSNTNTLKEAYGMSKNMDLSVNQSLYYGTRMLATKGFKGGVSYDKETGVSSFSFQGWGSDIKYYNWPGVKKYQEYVEKMISNSIKPTPSNY